MKKMKDSDCLLAISSLKNAIDVFLGPFLAAYFITKSVETLPQFSWHYVALYVANLVMTLLIFLVAKGRSKPAMFNVGIVTELLIVVMVVVLKEKLITYAALFGLARGISTQIYWYPFNQLNISCVSNDERYGYEMKKVVLSKVVHIVIPLVFAGLITATNFIRTGSIVLVLSMALVYFGFKVKGSADSQSFTFGEAFAHARKDPRMVPALLAYFLTGMYDTVASNMMSILIYMHNKSNMGLGAITAISSASFMVIQFILFKLRPKRRMTFIWISLVVGSAVVYCVRPCMLTVIILQICYTVFYGLLSLERTVFLFDIFHSYRGYYAFGEMNLNMGRAVGFTITGIVALKCPSALGWTVLGFLLLLVPGFAVQHRCERLYMTEAKS